MLLYTNNSKARLLTLHTACCYIPHNSKARLLTLHTACCYKGAGIKTEFTKNLVSITTPPAVLGEVFPFLLTL